MGEHDLLVTQRTSYSPVRAMGRFGGDRTGRETGVGMEERAEGKQSCGIPRYRQADKDTEYGQRGRGAGGRNGSEGT